MPASNAVSTDVAFSTTVSILGQMVDASVYLTGGQPSLIVVHQIPTVTFSTVYNQFVPGSSWPSQALDVTLKNSAIFYLKQQLTAAPPGLPLSFPVQVTNFVPGLFVATIVTLSLAGASLSAAAAIGQVQNQGLEADVNFGAPAVLFDSNFLVLSDTAFAGLGPHLTIGGGAGTLECGATLFGTQFGAASVTLTGGAEPSLAATLTYQGMLMGVSNPSLSLAWDKANGFHVTDFPILAPAAFIDIVKELQTISEAAGCGALGDLVLSKVVQTAFYVTPSVTTVAPQGVVVPAQSPGAKPVYVVISGFYKLMLADSTTIAAVDLPQLVLTLNAPSSLTFGSFLTTIGAFIEQNATAVVQQLWDDKPALGALAAVAVVPQVMNAVVANLACAGLKKLFTDFTGKLPNASGGGGGGGGGGAGGAGAGGQTAAQALAAAAAAAAALAGACAAGGNAAGANTGTALPAPILAAPSYANGAVTASWTAVAGAVGYRAQLIDAERNLAGPVQFLPAGTLQTTFPVPPTFVSGTGFVQVLARANGNTPALDSGFASQALPVYLPPYNVGLSWKAGVLSAYWQPVEVSGTGPITFNVRLYDDAAATRLVGTASGLTASSAVMTRTDGAAIATGQSYRVAVATVAGTLVGPFSPASPAFAVVVIPKPTNVTATQQQGQVLAAWQGIAMPAGLSGQILYTAEVVEMPQPGAVIDKTLGLPQTTASLRLTIKPGQSYAVRVVAGIGSRIGDYVYSPSFMALDSPVVKAMTYDAANQTVIVQFDGVAGADSYELGVRNSLQMPLNPGVAGVFPATPGSPQTVTLHGIAFNFQHVGSITVIAQARRGGDLGPWSLVDMRHGFGPAWIAITTLAAPPAPSASFGNDIVTVGWTYAAPPAGVVYAVELLRDHAVIETASTSASTARLALKLPAQAGGAIGLPAPGGSGPAAQYTVRVRATTATAMGLWSPETTVKTT